MKCKHEWDIDYTMMLTSNPPQYRGECKLCGEVMNATAETWCKVLDKCEKPTEQVHAPTHYDILGIEAIEIIARSSTVAEFKGFCRGNIIKYRLRVGKKDDVQTELDKADKYTQIFNDFKHMCINELS